MEATLDALEAELAAIQAAESRLTARKLTLLAAADAMQAPFIDGARTMAEWTARILDCETDTARRLVRTARGIPEGVFDRLADGDLTADRAHAYTEAALAGIPLEPLDGFELAGVRHLCRRRRKEPVSTEGYLVVQPQLDEAGYQVYGRLGAVQGSVVTQALEAEADRLCDGIPGSERPTRAELRADALTSLCEGGTRQAVVSVHHNAEGSVEIDGVAASRGDLEHATCVGAVEEDIGGQPMGETRQSISPRQRRRILYRDQHRCTIDGCVSRHRLEVHHIRHRSHGGDHDDDNLTTLCWFHHHVVVHRRGFAIDPASPEGRRRLIAPGHTRGPPH